MRIKLSGELQEFDKADKLQELLSHIGIDPNKNGIAIARNGVVIPKKNWQTEPLADGDWVEIVRASQGG
jgi:sulfur carrier protein